MKNFIVTTILFCFASIASAETFVLSQHGDWSVEFENPPNNAPDYCTMSSWNPNNELFVIVAHSNGSFDAHWSLEAPSWDKKAIMQGWFRGDFDYTVIEVDRNEFDAPLQKVSVLSTGNLWLLIVDLTPSFLRSISNGSYMRFETGAVWSLYGSASALAALDQCRSRLGGF